MEVKELLVVANYYFIKMVMEQNQIKDYSDDLVENILIKSSVEGESLEMTNGLFVYAFILGSLGYMPNEDEFKGISNKELIADVQRQFKGSGYYGKNL